jgi:hypothetical protein
VTIILVAISCGYWDASPNNPKKAVYMFLCALVTESLTNQELQSLVSQILSVLLTCETSFADGLRTQMNMFFPKFGFAVLEIEKSTNCFH